MLIKTCKPAINFKSIYDMEPYSTGELYQGRKPTVGSPKLHISKGIYQMIVPSSSDWELNVKISKSPCKTIGLSVHVRKHSP